jgi:TolB protein
MKTLHTPLWVCFAIFIFLISPSESIIAVATSPVDAPTPPEIVEQPRRSIYDPQYMENSRIPAKESALNPSATDYYFRYSATTLQYYKQVVGNEYNYEIYYLDNNQLTNLTNHEANDIHPRLNPGCTQIIFASDRTYNNNLDLFIMNVDGSNLFQVTWDAENDARPDWSRDSGWIVFESYRDAQAEIYIQAYDASNLTRLTWDGNYDGMPAWSPDGSKIAFVSNRTGGYRIYTMNTDGSGVIQLSDQPYSAHPVWSPDGSQIAFSADANGDGWWELWMMQSDGLSEQLIYQSPQENTDIIANVWSPNDSIIAFTQVNYVYYYGDWYWTSANILGWNYSTNNTEQIKMDNYNWYLDWQSFDTNPPVSSINQIISPQPFRFLLEWSGFDMESNIHHYDVQVRDGAQGTWADWRMATYYTNDYFEGLGGHTYYFRVRAIDNAGNIESWPEDYDLAVRIENSPPISFVYPVPDFTKNDEVMISWFGFDPGGSEIQFYNIEVQDVEIGSWDTWLVSSTIGSENFWGVQGHTYKFRSWGSDFASNLETPPLSGDTQTTFYRWMASGRVTDHTGTPILGAEIESSLTPFLVERGASDGSYLAAFSENLLSKTLTFSKAQYAQLPPSIFGIDDAVVDFILPPVDNLVSDWGFEDELVASAWAQGGVYSVSLDSPNAHSGESAAALGGESYFNTSTTLELPPSWDSEDMTIGPNGAFHLAEAIWLDDHYEIFYQQMRADGTWLLDERIYVAQASLSCCSIAVDSNNIVHLVWNVEGLGILYSWRELSGVWSQPEMIYSLFGSPQDMLVDQNDNLHILISTGYYSQKPSGGEWSDFEAIPCEYCDGFRMSISQTGVLHILYCSGTDDYLYHIQLEPGGTWTLPQQTPVKGSIFYSMVIDSQDHPHLISMENIFIDDIYIGINLIYTRQKLDGNWSSPEVIASGLKTIHWMDLCIDMDDTIYFVWNGSFVAIEGFNDLFYQQKVSGTQWSNPVNLSDSFNVVEEPDFAFVSQGSILATWLEHSGDNFQSFYIWVRKGEPGTPISLADPQPNFYSPKTIGDGKGGVHILWAEGDYESGELFHIGTAYALMDGDSWIAQQLTLPVSMTMPVLSFLYQLEGTVGAEGGNMEVLLESGGETSTLLEIQEDSAGWQHAWTDLSNWSGQPITLTFHLNEVQGTPMKALKLDEVTIGQARPDVWVAASGGLAGLPGEKFVLSLHYGNRGAVSADGNLLTFNLPDGFTYVTADPAPDQVDGSKVIWELDKLPAYGEPHTILMTLEVDSPGLVRTWVTSQAAITTQTEELELLNNIWSVKTYVGSLVLLPYVDR